MFTRIGPAFAACLGLLLVGSGLGGAFAQQGSSSVDVVRVESVTQAAAPQALLSPSEQLAAADDAVANATATCDAQAQALQTAQKESDIIRATCVDDKLAQCNANLQTLKRRRQALSDAIAANDAGSRNHEFAVIGVLSQKFSMLQQAASQCVGQDLFDTGETRVRQEVDLFAPDADPTVVAPVPQWPIPYIPPPVSGVN